MDYAMRNMQLSGTKLCLILGREAQMRAVTATTGAHSHFGTHWNLNQARLSIVLA
jgi:hypothetical protein